MPFLACLWIQYTRRLCQPGCRWQSSRARLHTTFACSLWDTGGRWSQNTPQTRACCQRPCCRRCRSPLQDLKSSPTSKNTAAGKDPILEQKEEMHHIIHKATPEQLGLTIETRRAGRRQHGRSGSSSGGGSGSGNRAGLPMAGDKIRDCGNPDARDGVHRQAQDRRRVCGRRRGDAPAPRRRASVQRGRHNKAGVGVDAQRDSRGGRRHDCTARREDGGRTHERRIRKRRGATKAGALR